MATRAIRVVNNPRRRVIVTIIGGDGLNSRASLFKSLKSLVDLRISAVIGSISFVGKGLCCQAVVRISNEMTPTSGISDLFERPHPSSSRQASTIIGIKARNLKISKIILIFIKWSICAN